MEHGGGYDHLPGLRRRKTSEVQGAAEDRSRDGKLYWDESKKPETYVDKKGKVQERTITVSKMAATDDAMTLVSKGRQPIELLYGPTMPTP